MANASRHWVNNPPMAKDFLDLVVIEVGTSGYQGTSLKPSSWKKIRDTLEISYPLVFSDVGDKQKFVKNRWNTLKKKYEAYKLCCSYTGNALDVNTGLFTFDDEQWESLRKQNSDCISFKTKPLENKTEMEAIFDGVTITWENSEPHGMMNRKYMAAKDAADANEDDEEVVELTGFTQDTYFEGVGFTSQENMETPITPMSTNQNIPSSSGTSRSSKRKRVEPTPTNDTRVAQLVSMVSLYLGTKVATSANVGDHSMTTILELIEAMEEEIFMDRERLNIAIKELAKSEELRKSFACLTSNAQRARLLETL